jgi:hypothetical protein
VKAGGHPGQAGAPAGQSAPDRFAAARAVADAVLYEGYVLYPYRASARKNQLRWQFGVLTPVAFSAADPSERSSLRTECLLAPGPAAQLSVRIRCLHVQHRAVEAAVRDGATSGAMYASVGTLKVDGDVFVSWDEAVDCVVDLPPRALTTLLMAAHEEHFRFAAVCQTEPIRDSTGTIAGRIVRSRQAVDGLARVEVSAAGAAGAAGDQPFAKVALTVQNLTAWTGSVARREDVLGQSLVAVHAMLAVDDGTFVSLLDPSPLAAEVAAGCHQDGLFPVLIGAGDVMLASPIILYDRPAIAPESAGDLYDATEIDEILALRVLTLTDEEKAEARATDPRAAAIVDRCDDMPSEMWSRLHGAVRALGPLNGPPPGAPAVPRSAPGVEVTVNPGRPVPSSPPGDHTIPPGSSAFSGNFGDSPETDATVEPGLDGPRSDPASDTTVESGAGPAVPWWDPASDATVDPGAASVLVGGVTVQRGTPVQLRPSHRADAHDLFLRDMTASVAGVFLDVDGNQHIAVTLDDDPARDELRWQGRYLYFYPDEIVPLTGPGSP